MAQEAVAMNFEHPLAIGNGPDRLGDGAVVVIRFRMRIAEGTEGVLPDEQTRCFLHGIQFQTAWHDPDQMPLQRMRCRCESIPIAFAAGTVAGVKITCHVQRAADRDIGWQQGIQGSSESLRFVGP
tara:strand:+ start:1439 stop:1816 length:378 start_codon:yes stop_codon:yes gene_type:complete